MKRLFAMLFCAVLLVAMLPTAASATPTVVAYDDGTIYVGGIYDMWAQISEGADRAAYQWQVSVGDDDYYGSGAWYDINDLAGDYGYKGTKTSHLQIVGKPNDDSVAIGSGWENMKFRCKITLDGKEYFTNSLSELRHNTAMLNAVIKAGKYKLYEPKVTGVDKLSGSGSSYTAKSAAGQELTFSISCKDVTDTRLVASEFKCIPEIWITDGDTTVHAANELKYTPTKADSQLTVEFKLRQQIGVNNLGYTETKTLQLSTYLPSGIGSGTAKNRTLIYTTASTSSKRLATVPTGGTVTIIEKVNNNWYKVAYNNKVGYAQAADLTAVVTQTVNEVKTYLPTPTVGKNPRFDATYATTGVQLYKTEPVSWYDETTKEFLTATDTFQSGHDYTLSIWVAAADGYRFRVVGDNIQVTGYVNDSVVSVYKAYEENAEKVIELRWTYTPVEATHTCSLTPVKQKDPDCTNPGKKAYYQCNSCGQCYSDAQGKNKITSIATWGVLPATNHTPSAWRTTQVYHYKACTTCGEFLEQDDHKGGNATCKDSALCSVCGYAYIEPNENHTPDTTKWTACGTLYHAHLCKICGAHCDIQDHTPGPEATEDAPQSCTVCGFILQPAKNHTHQLTHMPYVAATCLATGTVEHYKCSGCSTLFSDPEGMKPLPEDTSVIIPYLTHKIAEDWGMDESFHWRRCKLCQSVLEETKMVHEGNTCTTCSYVAGSEIPEPTQAPVPTQVASQADVLQPDAPQPERSWILPLLVALASFATAITTTVIVLKKKKK